jgi:chloramphenicol 3-O phosphotransferase
MIAGTIILLNGTVSAGKTSVARAIQHVMPEPYVHLGADILGAMCPPRYAGGTHAAEGFAWVPVPNASPPQTALLVGEYGHRLVEGLHHAIAAVARTGHHVVVDHIFQERHWLEHCLATWRDLSLYLIGLRCPLAVTEQRERDRRDRATGVARWQHGRVHAHARYDLEIDTSMHTPKECALLIQRRLREGPPTAVLHLTGHPSAEVDGSQRTGSGSG